jgi:DNA-binding MarR family transcriptional regulator
LGERIKMFRETGDKDQDVQQPAHVFVVGSSPSPVTCSEVIQIWDVRRSRRNHFPGSLFADPAWDILLHLYATELAGQRSTVTQVVHASNVPEATALRWLGHLLDLGLCRKRPDHTDRRRQFVSLTTSGMQAMDDYFAAVRASNCDPVLSQVA